MKPDEYIDSFFKTIEAQLTEAKIGKDRRSARYKDHVVAAKWSDNFWDIQLNQDEAEPIARKYDPANARSSQSAANYFVDALRRTCGEEPFPREPVRNGGYRPRT